MGLEWLYRLIKEPRRLMKRYLVGNTIFIYLVIKEYIRQNVFLIFKQKNSTNENYKT